MDNLYLDCDGVILDTIDVALANMRKNGLDTNNYELVNQYFVNVDWNKLIDQAGILDNAIDKINYLLRLKKYHISILTTCVNKDEPTIKKNRFSIWLPKVPVITVPWMINKATVVNSKNSILVDDSLNNINLWRNSGGIGLHYLKGNVKIENMEINNLEDVSLFDGRGLIK